MNKQKIIEKLEKEVKRTYTIKTAIFKNGEKVHEHATEYREPFVTLTIEMADKILAMLKEHDDEAREAYRRGLEAGRTIKWD
jgi:hypothetical protein